MANATVSFSRLQRQPLRWEASYHCCHPLSSRRQFEKKGTAEDAPEPFLSAPLFSGVHINLRLLGYRCRPDETLGVGKPRKCIGWQMHFPIPSWAKNLSTIFFAIIPLCVAFVPQKRLGSSWPSAALLVDMSWRREQEEPRTFVPGLHRWHGRSGGVPDRCLLY
ncbi:hypothetical protein Ddc_16264 [Ditylenchus destructor]|nr:hypothetical protein Ddc_16264 [Ditylenchus destructor]